MTRAIQICRDARAPHWQLGPLPPACGRLTLVAWTGVLFHDAGVPAAIGGMLARAWTSVASVTFLSSLSGVTSVATTREPGVAARAFEDAGFPWWMQGQAMLFFDPDARRPDVDQETLLALLDDDWVRRAAALEGKGVRGAARPGVDGDVAGLLTLDDSFDALLLESLEREARQAGMAWEIVPESALG